MGLLEQCGVAAPDLRDDDERLGGRGRIDGERAVVVPQLEGARLAEALDASPAAAGHDLDVAVERDQALAVAGLERVAAPDAPGHPDRTIRQVGGIEQQADTDLARPGQPPRERGLGPGHPQREPTRPRGRPMPSEGDESEDQRRGHRQPAEGSARSTTVPPLARTRSAGRSANTASGRPAAAHTTSCPSRSRSTRIVVPVAWPNGGTPPIANPVAARASSPSARRALVRAGGTRQLVQVDPVGAGDEGDDRAIVGHEHERLHDLGDLAADGSRRVGRRSSPFRKAPNLDREALRRGRLDDARHIRVHRPILGAVLGWPHNPRDDRGAPPR